MIIQMKVKGLMFDPRNNAYIIILRGEEGNEVLPIWVGKTEANSISLALEGIFTPRPMTHDLINNVLDSLDAKIISIVITDLRENTYFSKTHLSYQGSEVTIDSRPSDAIALALRADSPIFVSEHVIQKQSSEELDRWLENLKPEDFGQYDT